MKPNTVNSRKRRNMAYNLELVKKPDPTAFKMTDFRRELHLRHKREVHMRKERMQSVHERRLTSKYTITVDTSRARSNHDVLRMCVRELGFKEFPYGRKDQNCDVHWHAMSFEENPEVYSGSVNKFPGMREICSKMSLFRCLDQMRELFPSEYDFYPRTWYLPAQYHEFCTDVKRMHDKKVKPKPTFIVKPDTGAQGEGIYLLRDPNDYSSLNSRCHVAQEYLNNVYLIDKFKFDLRVYVLLKSVEPLEFYICKEGLARFSTVPYENPTYKNLHESFMHLTNYSLNKKSNTFNRSEREDEGSKRSLTSVLRKIENSGHDSARVWRKIEEIVCKTIIAIVPEIKVEFQAAIPVGKPGPSCFEILGFDILLLENLKPYLLEVNAAPSLGIDSEQEVAPGVFEYLPSPKDEEVKRPLVRDTLLMVCPQHKLRHCLQERKRRRSRRQKQREKEAERRRNCRLEPIHKQRTHILIIKADESDEEKRERDVTQQMSEMSMDIDVASENTNRESTGTNETSETDEVDKQNNNNNSHTDKEEIKSLLSEEEYDNDYSRWKEESCLKQLYPTVYEEEFERLRLLERVAALFVFCLGVRGAQRIGPTGFRTFARRCRLNKKGITNAAIDIMYIDLQRRWDHMNPERTSGLCFQGFLDACVEIARRRFYSDLKYEMLTNLLDYCESNLTTRDEDSMTQNMPRLHFRKLGLAYNRPYLPRTLTAMTEETIADLYVKQSKPKQKNSVEDVENFLRERRQLAYQATPLHYLGKKLDDSDE